MTIDEREIQYRMQFYHHDQMRERDNDRLRKIAQNGRLRGFSLLRFKLPRLWRPRTIERPEKNEIPVKRYPAESGVS